MKNYKLLRYAAMGVFFSIVLSLPFGCEIQENFSYKKSGSTAELGITAWEYIQQNDSLAFLEEAILLTGTQSLYESSAKKTFVAPTNEAFKKFLVDNSYQDLSQVPVPILRNTIKYHIVDAVVSFDDPTITERNNPLPYPTENGQTLYLSRTSGYAGLINEGTNKQWQILTSNLKPTNGVIHLLPSIVYFSARTTSNSPDAEVVRDTIFAVADTYVNGGASAASNFGSDNIFKVKSAANPDFLRKGFLMFNLKDFDKPGIIVDMTLELAVKFTAAKGIEFNIFEAGDTLWTESGITYSNAPFPTSGRIATITTSKISKFEFSLINYYKGLDHNGKVAFMIDQEDGKDETDEFYTKENVLGENPPMLIARFASGNTTLVIEKNSGFSIESGEAYVLNESVLEVSGSIPGDVSFTVLEAPQNGWLVKGPNILQVGQSFTQEDINAMNVVYINNGGSEDRITVDGKDKAGATLPAFDITIAVQ